MLNEFSDKPFWIANTSE